MKELLFLVGFRAVGKTTIGKILAEILRFGFVDTDALITDQAGKSIREIVAEEGWPGFRGREADVLQGLSGLERVVAATGGGAVLHHEFWQKNKDISVIWLKADEQVILSRMINDQPSGSGRPPLSGQDIASEISDTLLDRTPLYKNIADFTIDTSKLNPKQAAEKAAYWYRTN